MFSKDTLLKLLAPSAPTGFERAVADVIKDELAPFADSIETDPLGNLIVRKKGPGKKLMLAAHMDQIGFMVTDIDDKGFLRVARLGGIYLTNALARHVVLASGARGVLCEETDRDGKPLDFKHLFIDVGATCREEAEKAASIGDWAVFAPQVSLLGDSRVASPYMDDRAGCALLVEAFKLLERPDNDIYAVFTVQEEVGLRGAKTAAYAVDPDVGIAIDVTPAFDPPKAARGSVALGGGIAVKVMDSSVVCHPAVRALMEDAARKAGVKYQLEVLTAGGTDSGAISLSRGGVRTGVLSIPCRYVHSPAETIDMGDYEGGVKLLAHIMRHKLDIE